MNRTRFLKRGLVAPLLVVACLVPTMTHAEAARLEFPGCSRYAKPTVTTTYTAERMKVAFRFEKCIEDEGDPTPVVAGLSRSSLEGSGGAMMTGMFCDSSWPCKVVVRLPHPGIERAEYDFNVAWIGLNGREQTWDSEPTWCTSTPILAQCDETPVP